MDKNISILGVGKLGLCLALNLERKDFNIIGVDIFEDYIQSLNNKTFTTSEPYVNEYLQESQNILMTEIFRDTEMHESIVLNQENNQAFVS
jgi:UDP-N-acetyl-D-mannosaminuronate dehydrogenase